MMRHSRLPRNKTISKPGPKARFAVYAKHPAKVAAIHSVIAGIDGDYAFVYTHSQRRALILPASCVFDTQEDAERFLAGKGPYKWCVAHLFDGKDNIREGRVMFEARVSQSRRSHGGFFETIIVPKNPALDEKVKRHYQLEIFDTKRKASAYLRERLTEDLKTATKESKDWYDELDRLQCQYNAMVMS